MTTSWRETLNRESILIVRVFHSVCSIILLDEEYSGETASRLIIGSLLSTQKGEQFVNTEQAT